MEFWCTVTWKEYENLVYCNLAAILHVFFLSSNIQIKAWADKNYAWAGQWNHAWKSLKSDNYYQNLVYCNLKTKCLHHLMV